MIEGERQKMRLRDVFLCTFVCGYVRQRELLRVNVRFKVTAWQFMETTI